jgi:hypothetical protein
LRSERGNTLKRYSIVLIVVIGISTSAAAASLEHSIFGSRETERASLDLGNACVPPVGGYARGILAGAEVPMRYSTAAEAGYSLLVPGLGQCRMGRPTRGKIYFGLEALSWFFIGASLWQGYTQDGEFKEYATYYAGVEGTGHGDDYWEAVGSYMSSGGPGGYNEAVRRDARDLYYPDIDLMNAYYEQHKITGELAIRA